MSAVTAALATVVLSRRPPVTTVNTPLFLTHKRW